MTFKENPVQFQIIDLSLIDADPDHARHNISADNLKGLVNSIHKIGVIHPIVVLPANSAGRYTVVVGERRRQAALLAGEQSICAVIRSCTQDEMLEVQVFENIGLGVRSALDPRDMANAVQSIAERFTTPEEAAEHFGRAPTWLSQATAAANLSEKVTALLDTGKISSTSTAVQLEKLSQKNETRADSLIDQIKQLPEGEKISKKVVDNALAEESGRRKKQDTPTSSEIEITNPAVKSGLESMTIAPATEETSVTAAATQNTFNRNKINPGKIKRVAELLGLSNEDEDEILIRLIDQFLSQQQD
jgi:ParB family chromosome partitioning protein